MKRRHFAKNIGLGLLTTQSYPLFSSTNFIANNTTKVPIGICNHSLRSMGLNAKQLIEYAIKHNLDSVLFNTFGLFDNLEDSYLKDLRRLAQSADVRIYVGAGGISKLSPNFSDKYGAPEKLVMEGIRVAGLLGSPIIGLRIGSIQDRYINGGIEAHIEAVVKVLKAKRQQAMDAGIKFAFENHAGDMRTSELLTLINEIGTDICGALFDPANSVWAMESPMEALENLGTTILCTSVRDIQLWESSEGVTFQGMAIGDGIIDFSVFAKKMAERSPGVPMHIETISNSARPVPFLKSEFWEAYPNLPASELADFLKFVKKGRKMKIISPPPGVDKKTFDIENQQSELLKSVDYLRNKCYAGLK